MGHLSTHAADTSTHATLHAAWVLMAAGTDVIIAMGDNCGNDGDALSDGTRDRKTMALTVTWKPFKTAD